MNFNLSQIPDRQLKPRHSGITMVMDKGLSIEEAKNFMSIASPHVDILKLAFGTSSGSNGVNEPDAFDGPKPSAAISSCPWSTSLFFVFFGTTGGDEILMLVWLLVFVFFVVGVGAREFPAELAADFWATFFFSRSLAAVI